MLMNTKTLFAAVLRLALPTGRCYLLADPVEFSELTSSSECSGFDHFLGCRSRAEMKQIFRDNDSVDAAAVNILSMEVEYHRSQVRKAQNTLAKWAKAWPQEGDRSDLVQQQFAKLEEQKKEETQKADRLEAEKQAAKAKAAADTADLGKLVESITDYRAKAAAAKKQLAAWAKAWPLDSDRSALLKEQFVELQEQAQDATSKAEQLHAELHTGDLCARADADCAHPYDADGHCAAAGCGKADHCDQHWFSSEVLSCSRTENCHQVATMCTVQDCDQQPVKCNQKDREAIVKRTGVDYY